MDMAMMHSRSITSLSNNSFPNSRMTSTVPSRGPTPPCSTRCSSSSAPYCVWFSPGEQTSFLAVECISDHWGFQACLLTHTAKSVSWTVYYMTQKKLRHHLQHSWWCMSWTRHIIWKKLLKYFLHSFSGKVKIEQKETMKKQQNVKQRSWLILRSQLAPLANRKYKIIWIM